MGLLKRIHENAKAGADAPINPLIADGGAQIASSLLLKTTAKILDRATEDYVFEGKKQGYAEASDVYEKKLLEQANMFTKEKDAFTKERDEYEDLLDKFDKRICELQEKVNKSQQEVVLLNELLLKERELRKLSE